MRWDIVSGIMSSWQGKAYLERPQDLPFVGTSEPVDVINHCAWGSVCNAGAGLGKFVPDAYGVARWAIYVRVRLSEFAAPEDLADVPIAVGMRAGSHFNVPYRLEAYMPLEQIKTVNVGGFGARLIGAARRRSRGDQSARSADLDGRPARVAACHRQHVQNAVGRAVGRRPFDTGCVLPRAAAGRG